MRRRTFLGSGIALATALGGCLGRSAERSTTSRDEPPGSGTTPSDVATPDRGTSGDGTTSGSPRDTTGNVQWSDSEPRTTTVEWDSTDLPPAVDPPSSPTASEATTYVAELARREIAERAVDEDTTEISLTCRGTLAGRLGNGYVVVGGCGGYRNSGGGVADYGGTPTFYYVGDGRVVRVASPDSVPFPRETTVEAESPWSIRLLNFGSDPREFEVRITGDAAPDVEDTVRVPGEDGLDLEGIPGGRSSATVRVAVDGRTATTTRDRERWDVTAVRGPAGSLACGYAPVEEIRSLGPV